MNKCGYAFQDNLFMANKIVFTFELTAKENKQISKSSACEQYDNEFSNGMDGFESIGGGDITELAKTTEK